MVQFFILNEVDSDNFIHSIIDLLLMALLKIVV